MTEIEKRIIRALGDPLYTQEFLAEWVDRNDNVFINAPAALQVMAAKGYYQAVQRMAQTVPQWDERPGSDGCGWCKKYTKPENWECCVVGDSGTLVAVGDANALIWTSADFCPVCGRKLRKDD